MIYVVIDTNVFVSALFTRHPNSATTKVVEALTNGQIILLYNEQIINEYQEVLSREKFHISPYDRQKLLYFIREHGLIAERIAYGDLFIDETDRVFYEISLSKEDSFLVTGNLKHFPEEPRVVTPAEMIEILEKE